MYTVQFPPPQKCVYMKENVIVFGFYLNKLKKSPLGLVKKWHLKATEVFLKGTLYLVCMCVGGHRQATAHCESEDNSQELFSPSTQWVLGIDSDHQGANTFTC